MTSAEALCPECGHSPLNHKRGQCLVIITLPKNKLVPTHGERTKAHCGCTYFSRQLSLQMEMDLDPD